MIRNALKAIQKRDSDIFRRKVYEDLKSRSALIKMFEFLYDRSPHWFKSCLLLSYGLKSWFDAPSLKSEKHVGIYLYPNEKKQFLFIQELLRPEMLSFKQVHLTVNAFFRWRYPISLVRVLKTLNFIARRYDFLVSCRMSSTLFYYFWFNQEFRTKRIQYLYLSSEANPYAMGALWASKKFGVHSVYIPHGYIADSPPPLSFNTALLDGPAFRDIFKNASGGRCKIIFKGCFGDYFPLNTAPLSHPKRIGVFLSIISSPEKVVKILHAIREHFQTQEIILRLHPNETLRNRFIRKSGKKMEGVRVTEDTRLADDISLCDLVICGNSGVHLEVLRQGVPTLQVADLDLLPHDARHFVRNKVVPYYPDVRDVSIPEVMQFYSDDWSERFRFYDYYYGKTHTEIIDIVKEEIRLEFNDSKRREA